MSRGVGWDFRSGDDRKSVHLQLSEAKQKPSVHCNRRSDGACFGTNCSSFCFTGWLDGLEVAVPLLANEPAPVLVHP